jgi:hypothetical protein
MIKKISVNIAMIVVFWIIYMAIDRYDPKAFNKVDEVSDSTSFLYFSIITHTTVGYGDIYPLSKLARLFVCLQVLTVLFQFI